MNLKDSLAKDAYYFVAGGGTVQFNQLYESSQAFYLEVADWHLGNGISNPLKEVASHLFDDIMICEQKRRKETNPIQRGGLDVMSEGVKENYCRLAEWHLNLLERNNKITR